MNDTTDTTRPAPTARAPWAARPRATRAPLDILRSLPPLPSVLEVIALRSSPTAPAAATTAVRLRGLLPAHWACQTVVEHDRVRLRIHLTLADNPHTVRRTVTTVLTDPALRGWTEQR